MKIVRLEKSLDYIISNFRNKKLYFLDLKEGFIMEVGHISLDKLQFYIDDSDCSLVTFVDERKRPII